MSTEVETVEWRRAIFHSAERQYVGYFVHYAEQHRGDWAELGTEYVNLLVAAQRLFVQDDYPRLTELRDILQPHLDLQGHWADSLALNGWAIAVAQAHGDRISTARFTHDRADILNQLGEYQQAEDLYRVSEEAYLALGEKELALHSRHMRALVVRAQGRLAEADRLCEATIAEARQLGLEGWLAHPLYVQALLARDRGDFDRAECIIRESLSRIDSGAEKAMAAQCHHFMGELALLRGRLVEARAQSEISLQMSREVGILRRIAATQRLLGDVACAERHYDEAEMLYHEALSLARELDDRPQQAKVLMSHGRLKIDQGAEREATRLLQNSKVIYQSIGDARGLADVSLSLALLYLKRMQLNLVVEQSCDAVRGAWTTGLLKPGALTRFLLQRVGARYSSRFLRPRPSSPRRCLRTAHHGHGRLSGANDAHHRRD